MLLEALGHPFFQRVLFAGLLSSVACGVIGTYVVAKRIGSISGGISHAAFGGVGLGYLLGFSPMLGAAGFGMLAGVLVGVAQRRLRAGMDTLISMVWSLGMALGILFVALAPGYAPDLMSYLFGSLLFVPRDYVVLVGALDVVILVVVVLLHRRLEAVCFDEEFSEAAGLPVGALFVGLLALTSLAIVALIRVVGVILAIALLTMPAATARQWADSLRGMMVIAVLLCAVCTTGGLLASYALSYAFDISAPPGPLVVLLAGVAYGVSSLLRRGRA
jgi:zinc transport system permease protein